MSTQDYVQYGLAPLSPLDAGVKADQLCVVKFVVTLGVDDDSKAVTLSFEDTTTKEAYITITDNSLIQIELKGDQLYFSEEFEAITTKEPLSSFYGNICYDEASYVKKYNRYKMITFDARANTGGKFGTIHRFNINVDLLQSSDCEEPRFIALTIDPTINNPPPVD